MPDGIMHFGVILNEIMPKGIVPNAIAPNGVIPDILQSFSNKYKYFGIIYKLNHAFSRFV